MGVDETVVVAPCTAPLHGHCLDWLVVDSASVLQLTYGLGL